MHNETHPICSRACHCSINSFGRIHNCHTYGCIMSRIETGHLEKENTALVKIQTLIEDKEICNNVECDILVICNDAIGENPIYHPEHL